MVQMPDIEKFTAKVFKRLKAIILNSVEQHYNTHAEHIRRQEFYSTNGIAANRAIYDLKHNEFIIPFVFFFAQVVGKPTTQRHIKSDLIGKRSPSEIDTCSSRQSWLERLSIRRQVSGSNHEIKIMMLFCTNGVNIG